MNQIARVDHILDGFVRQQHSKAPPASCEVLTLLSHIHDNLFEPGLSVKTAMLRCDFRDNNITSRFRIYLGVGMREYIENLRMQAALCLLQHPDCKLAIIDLAMVLGYEYPQTFYRAFFRRFGCTPATFRQQVV